MLRKLLFTTTLAFLLLSTLAFWGEQAWVLDLLAVFRVYYLGVFLLLALGALCCQYKGIFTMALLGILLNAASVLPVYFPPPQQPVLNAKNTMNLTVLQCNLLYVNPHSAPFIHYVHQVQPDIITLEEMNYRWRKALLKDAFFRKQYPFYVYSVQKQLALFSRFPLKQPPLSETNLKHPMAHEVLLSQIRLASRDLTVVVVHLKHPTNGFLASTQREVVSYLVAHQQDYPRPLIVIGDFNATPWSAQFRHLKHALSLADSRQGFGIQPTWGPFGVPLFPIDHALISQAIRVQNRLVGPDIGSDHRPVLLKITF